MLYCVPRACTGLRFIKNAGNALRDTLRYRTYEFLRAHTVAFRWGPWERCVTLFVIALVNSTRGHMIAFHLATLQVSRYIQH